MAIDPSISLGVRIPQIAIPQFPIQSPLEKFQRIQSLRQMMEQSQYRALQMQQLQQEMETARQAQQREQAFMNYFRNPQPEAPATPGGIPAPVAPSIGSGTGGAPYTPMTPTAAPAGPEGFFPASPAPPARPKLPSAMQTFGTLGPKAGAPVAQAIASLEADQRKADAEHFKLERDKWKAWGALAGTAKDEKSKNNAVMVSLSKGWITPEQARALFARPFDAGEYETFRLSAIDAENQAADAVKRAELPGTVADTAAKVRIGDASILAAAAKRGPESLNAALAALPPERQAHFAGATTPKEIMQRALTPEQFAAGERAKASAEQQLWTTPGGLTSIIKNPNSSASDVARATEQLNLLAGYHSVASPPLGPISPERLQQDIDKAVRISKLTGEGPKAVRAEIRAQGIGTQWQQSSKLLERYRVAASGYDSVKQMLSGGGPQDLAVIYGFAKAMDPESVVRESEVENAMKTGNIFSGALARFNGLWKPGGGFLSPQVKQDFLKAIKTRMESTRKQVFAEHAEIKRQQEVISPGSSEALYNPGVLDPEDFKAKDLKSTSTDDLLRTLLEKRK